MLHQALPSENPFDNKNSLTVLYMEICKSCDRNHARNFSKEFHIPTHLLFAQEFT